MLRHAVRPAERPGRVEAPDPLAALTRGDRAAVVVDEGHRGVPVAAGEVDGGVVLVRLPERGHQLGVGRVELGQRLRHLRDPGLLVLVGAVDQSARAGVIRHGVELPVVAAGRRQAGEPGARIRERALAQRCKRAGGAVLGNVGVAELEDVRAARRERRLELRLVVAPALVLDVDGDARVLRAERAVGCRDGRGPVRLGVAHQPNGDGICLLARRRTGRGRRRNEREAERGRSRE